MSAAKADDRIDDALIIAEAAALTPLDYERRRAEFAERLGITRLSVLDTIVQQARNSAGGGNHKGQGRPVEFAAAAPWPDAVDGTVLFAALAETVRKHVVLTEEHITAVVLWVVFTHLFGLWDVAPKLLVGSPQLRCGKTRLLLTLRLLVPRPLKISNATPAALFRVIDEHQPCLLIDEADSFARDDPELRNLLNSGFDANDGFLRNVPGAQSGTWEPRLFVPWCPQCVAGIGNLHKTTEDRGLRIILHRKLVAEEVMPLDPAAAARLTELMRQTARWSRDNRARIAAAPRPPRLAGLNDRAAESWLPLRTIAHAAAGNWDGRATAAAAAISADREETESSLPVMLLADARDALAVNYRHLIDPDFVPGAVLIGWLLTLPDRPWGELGRPPRPLTQNRLARLLQPFEIYPSSNGGVRGYRRERFETMFERYL
jgi:Protein of unknown function (DUF3631)